MEGRVTLVRDGVGSEPYIKPFDGAHRIQRITQQEIGREST